MSIFSVYLPISAKNRKKAADKAAFVQDRFSFSASLFGPLWLLWNRLWLALAAYVFLAILVASAVGMLGLALPAAAALFGLMDVYLGYEGQNMLAARLERRGFALNDIVAGSHIDDVERRFFDRWSLPGPSNVPGNGA